MSSIRILVSRIFIFCIVFSSAFSQTQFNPSQITFASKFSSPPQNPKINTPYLFTDAVSTGTCTGGGTSYAWCVWSGFSYVTPSAGSVLSVFNRTGAVQPQAGDYFASQVTNAVDQTQSYTNPSWIVSIPSTKITGLGTAATHGPSITINGVTCTLDGTCTVSGSSGSITSVFGRAGPNITAQTGDYTAAQVTNAVDSTQSYSNPSWITSLAYSKLTGSPTVPSISGSTILKGSGGNAIAATAGTDYVLPSGNVATATALATTPTLCASGLSPRGILANGNATGCASNVLYLPITLSGCACNGTTDDTATVQTWLNSVANGTTPVTISLAGVSVYLGTATVSSPFTVPSNVEFIGPGSFVGPAFSSPNYLPVATILLQGTLGSPITYTSTIPSQTSTFTVSNTGTYALAANNMFLLSNFPYDTANVSGTYPQGSDTCTLNTGSSQTYCTYPLNVLGNDSNGVGPNNRRQLRLREVGTIRSATTSGFVTESPVLNNYTSTASLQFQQVSPNLNFTVRDVDFVNIEVQCDLCRNVSIRGGLWASSGFSVTRSVNVTFDVDEMRARSSDASFACGGGSRFLVIRGLYHGGSISSDNGIVRIDQCSDVDIDMISYGGTSGSYGAIIDTNYAEDPGIPSSSGKGYPYTPDWNVNLRAVFSGDNNQSGLFVSGNPFYAPVYNFTADIVSPMTNSTGGSALHLGGIFGGKITSINPAGSIYASANNTLTWTGQAHTFYHTNQTDEVSGSVATSNNNNFNDFRFIAQSGDNSGNDSLNWWFNNMNSTRWSDITFDMSQTPDTAPNIRIAGTSNNFYLGHLTYLPNTGISQTKAVYCDSTFTGEFRVVGDTPAILSGCPTTSTTLNGFTSLFGGTIGNPASSSQIVPITRHVRYSGTWSPATIANGSYVSTNFSLYSVPQGESIVCGFSSLTTSYPGIILTASATSFGQGTAYLFNQSGSSVSIPAGNLACWAMIH